jgi:iron complex outermembrane receptor protein
MKPRVALQLGWLLVLVLLFASEGAAQQLSLSGTVRDTTGVVPDATVTLSSGGTEIGSTRTDQSGAYRFTGLSAGSYEVAAAMAGFETAVRTVALRADMPAVDFSLAVGRVSSSVTVTAAVGRATATRLPVSNVDVPAQVSVVSQELIAQQGLNTVGDALRNASGVQSFRWYGVYEQYTIRGFNDPDRDAFNVVLYDGLRRGGNRYATQTNNIQAVEVLKGPNSILYGRGAVGGTINIVRKKPQMVRAYDLMYRGGRFNTHQVAAGATGAVGGSSRVAYRVDSGFEASDGWRNAGADRFNFAPSLTAQIGSRARLTVQQTFVRDKFDGDGGVPLNMVDHPSFERDLRFSLPQDRVLVEDSTSQFHFNGTLASAWDFRNSMQLQRMSDQYFVTEGVYGDPDAGEVFREPLDFHHIRRPFQNQSEIVGRLTGAGTHNLMFGYEYQRDKYRTEVTAGDDPDCICGYWYLTIPSMDIRTMRETLTAPLDLDAVARTTFVNDHIHSFYWQDQIDILPQLKVNIGHRMDAYDRAIDRVGGLPFTPVRREQTAHSYRAGLVYAPRDDQQVYFGTSSSFTPVNTVPANGAQLEPSTARNFEIGHRWQGWNGRVDTNAAFYYAVRNNVNVQQTPTTVLQVGEQRSKGFDADVNTALGGLTYLVFNYGFSAPRYGDDAGALAGLAPRFAPRHNVNAWLRKEFPGGFNAAFGARHVGEQFANNGNTLTLDRYTIFSGAVGFRTSRWDWTVNADNLFNNDDYFLPGHFSNLAFPGQPINVTTTVRLRWN